MTTVGLERGERVNLYRALKHEVFTSIVGKTLTLLERASGEQPRSTLKSSKSLASLLLKFSLKELRYANF